jgi:cytochrome c553
MSLDERVLALAAVAALACNTASAEPASMCGKTPAARCDVSGFMKARVAPELKGKQFDELAESLEAVARSAPPGFTDWSRIAQEGAAAARNGDAEGARRSCGECHGSYRKRYRTEMRVASTREP